MTAVVVPFREGKSRLSDARHVRRTLGLAMLGDVVAACGAVGSVRMVTDDAEAAALAVSLGAEHVDDPGGGQGAAVAAALAGLAAKPVLVVNADVPAVVPQDLRDLLHGTPRGGVAVVAAVDGTTNALSLPSPDAFAPLYGQDSATRFLTHALDLGLPALEVEVPSLVDDVDTLEDLERLQLRAGPRTQAAFLELEREPAP